MTPSSHRHIRYVWDSQCVSKMQRPGSLLVQCDCDGGCKIKSPFLRTSASIQFSLCNSMTQCKQASKHLSHEQFGAAVTVESTVPRLGACTKFLIQDGWGISAKMTFVQQSLCNETAFKG